MTRQGIQRFKCKSCNKTFNALADSPLYRMKKSEKWIEYTKLMWEGVSLRKSAKALDITLRTSFRWQHMFKPLPASIHQNLQALLKPMKHSYRNLLKVRELLTVNHANVVVDESNKSLSLLRLIVGALYRTRF
jgi:hypothetical protein